MDYSDPDRDLMLFVTVMVLIALVGAAAYGVIWMVRSSLNETRYRARREREREDRQYDAHLANAALENDLLDWGVPRGDLMTHRSVYTDYNGAEHVEYDLPREQFVQQIKQAARLHRDVVERMGGGQHHLPPAQRGEEET